MLLFTTSAPVIHPATQLQLISEGVPMTIRAVEYLCVRLGYDALQGAIGNAWVDTDMDTILTFEGAVHLVESHKYL